MAKHACLSLFDTLRFTHYRATASKVQVDAPVSAGATHSEMSVLGGRAYSTAACLKVSAMLRAMLRRLP